MAISVPVSSIKKPKKIAVISEPITMPVILLQSSARLTIAVVRIMITEKIRAFFERMFSR